MCRALLCRDALCPACPGCEAGANNSANSIHTRAAEPEHAAAVMRSHRQRRRRPPGAAPQQLSHHAQGPQRAPPAPHAFKAHPRDTAIALICSSVTRAHGCRAALTPRHAQSGPLQRSYSALSRVECAHNIVCSTCHSMLPLQRAGAAGTAPNIDPHNNQQAAHQPPTGAAPCGVTHGGGRNGKPLPRRAALLLPELPQAGLLGPGQARPPPRGPTPRLAS